MDKSLTENKIFQERCRKLNVAGFKRHLLICAGPKCCSPETGEKLWQFVKTRMKDLNLVNNDVFRTKAGCLRICQHGPVALVYPEGTWYAKLDEQKCERIIQEHLIDGMPVKEYAFAETKLFEESSES